MQVVARELAVQQLNTTNFNDTVTAFSREAGGFGV
jgi:hypothetical protein